MKKGQTNIREKIAYGLGGIGFQMTLALTNAFLILYYTDSVLLSAAFIGGMMFVARMLDGATDFVAGYIIEKTRTRWGKARPWIIISAPFLALSVILMFNVPAGMSQTATNVYVFVTYVFMTAICYTFTNLAHNAMLPRITLVSEDRNRTVAVQALMMGITTALLVGAFVPALDALGGESSQRAWTIMSFAIAIISMVLLVICFFAVKEKLPAHDNTEVDVSKNSAVKTPVKESVMFLMKSKYFYILILLYLTLAITNGSAGITVYFMRDVLGDAGLMGIFSIISVVAMIGTMPFVPKIFALVGKRRTLIIGLSVATIMNLVRLVAPTFLPLQLGAVFLSTAFIVPLWIATPTMICDLVDFGDWKKGIRTEGFTTSASSFGTKLGLGIGSFVLGIGLSLGRYDPLAYVQSQQTVNAIIIINIALPAVLTFLCLVCVLMWDLDKTRTQVEAYMAKKIEGDDDDEKAE